MLFEQKKCKPCDELHLDVFKRKQSIVQLERFDVVVLDMWSDEMIVTPSGEKMKTRDTVISSVIKGFEPFKSELMREVIKDDVERLLKIPIRRISLYDINKAKKEMQEIRTRLKKIRAYLTNIKAYAVAFLDKLIESAGDNFKRMTEIISFEKVDVREVIESSLFVSTSYGIGSSIATVLTPGLLTATSKSFVILAFKLGCISSFSFGIMP